MASLQPKAWLPPAINLIRLHSFPILHQLMLEERLLRTTSDNWCILNDGTHPPSIVMGISGLPQTLLQLRKVVQDQVPVIKRFSGGGTVIVDDGTLFVTLICSRGAVQGIQPFPRPIMHWTEKFYKPIFKWNSEFQLREHDYVFGELKFGGNAQSIIKDRWLHHTSFLWDYKDSRMAYLKLPNRAPSYRAGRKHEDFICRLKDHFVSRNFFFDSIKEALNGSFCVNELSIEDIPPNESDYIRTTKLLTQDELRSCLDSVLND